MEDTGKSTWKRLLSLRRSKSTSHASRRVARGTSPVKENTLDQNAGPRSASPSRSEYTTLPASPLATLTSSQLTVLAASVLHQLESDPRHPTESPTPALVAARALASPHRHSVALASQANVKLAQLPENQLHRLALDVEDECERRFPDLAVSAVSVVAQKDVETVQRGSRTFLSLSRRAHSEFRNDTAVWLAEGDYDEDEVEILPNTTNGEMMGSGPNIEQPDLEPPPTIRIPPRRFVLRSTNRIDTSEGAGVQSDEMSDVETSFVREYGSRVISESQQFFDKLDTSEGLDDIPRKPASNSSQATLIEEGVESLPALPNSRLPRIDTKMNAKTASMRTSPSSPNAPNSPSLKPFTAALSILTTPQLLAAVRDVRGIMARRHNPYGAAKTHRRNNSNVTVKSTKSTGESEPALSETSDDDDENLTYCEQLLLRLPMSRIRIIWAAVADEVRRRGLDVNVHSDLDTLTV
ncbi:hypothetical protein SpCBS45565_g07822 [Spizellomyces sp. 'palustris']|nr:hypothetical protein SpCBS45565_g07822 [Spizellomyces sp. 'palustris']